MAVVSEAVLSDAVIASAALRLLLLLMSHASTTAKALSVIRRSGNRVMAGV